MLKRYTSDECAIYEIVTLVHYLYLPGSWSLRLVLFMSVSLGVFDAGHGKASRNDNSAKKISEYFKVRAFMGNFTFLVLLCKLVIVVTPQTQAN